ncbi:molybdopterin cofactor-binding domain-containing protein [Sphingomonas sp. DT-204]|uniref:xanthine dehydrogenase family protein molybdopterin-binding subunit n=1 Tax=Sphingomonas sp. DT-204 TaxID=3396166 RepID=UPI003F1C8CE0
MDRRTLLIGGGAAAGLVVAYALWPRAHVVNLPAAEGETVFAGWIKIGTDGHVTVAVPQCEHGQGVYTALPQIVADELGADWRTVGVEAAPESGLYANPLAAEVLFGPDTGWRHLLDGEAPMLTAGSSSVRRFEAPLRRAGALARALLMKAAAGRWDADWRTLRTEAGFVVRGNERLRFGELAAEAARESLPGDIPPRDGQARLAGTPAPRLDAPAKVDGSANFAGDIRLPGMVFAAVRHGPVGASRLVRVDRRGAERVPGMLHIVEHERWVAAVANTWWAANRALEALDPRFETPAPLVDSAAIDRALAEALARPGERVAGEGDLPAVFSNAHVVSAEYHVGAGLHAAIEPVTATASYEDGKLILYAATQAPQATRAAAARAIGIAPERVVLHPMMAGGAFGANLESEAVAQAALLTRRLGKPVQLGWSRAESLMRPPPRPPARLRMLARLGAEGGILGWQAAVAAPSLGHELAERLGGAGPIARALHERGDAVAVDGAAPAYRLPAWAVDHHPAEIGIPSGWWRSGGHFATCFATESFVDELANAAGTEPLSYRISMLGAEPRLARCLTTIASLGGWQGGVPGSGQGVACHRFRGSRIALMVEAGMDGGRPRVDRMVAAVDCGRVINPELVLQAIEGGLIFGLAAATGASTGYTAGRADARSFRDLRLPRLADTPDITVELIESDAEPGGVSELGVPVVAPALANAIASLSGNRYRRLPL